MMTSIDGNLVPHAECFIVSGRSEGFDAKQDRTFSAGYTRVPRLTSVKPGDRVSHLSQPRQVTGGWDLNDAVLCPVGSPRLIPVADRAGVDALTYVNAMTVDVEDYFQVTAFERHISRANWDRMPHRVEGCVDRILGLFSQHDVKGTFFTLGWIAARYPAMVRRIVTEGHELASHGWEHVRVTEQSRAEFRADVARTKSVLEDTGGCSVLGYRAASYSIGERNLWALKVLDEAGYHYSSSIYPIHHDIYGMPGGPRFQFKPRSDSSFLEIPITTLDIGGQKLPCGGGGYFRLFPYAFSRWAMRRVNRLDRQSCVFYFHPWEIDPDQPRQRDLRAKTRVRHYLNLHRMEARVDSLLRDFCWGRMDEIFLAEGRRG